MRAQSLIAFTGLLLLTAAANAAPQSKVAPRAPAPSAQIEFADAGQANQVSPEIPSTNTIAPADKKICKRIESTVSRMAKRVCLTKQEWDQVEQEIR
ncbi:MAG TPA: hypothetical protein VFK19_11620 [Sphingomicrobium sp.]|nr:hypothetical protein [Sphingomicrobium sp.]